MKYTRDNIDQIIVRKADVSVAAASETGNEYTLCGNDHVNPIQIGQVRGIVVIETVELADGDAASVAEATTECIRRALEKLYAASEAYDATFRALAEAA